MKKRMKRKESIGVTPMMMRMMVFSMTPNVISRTTLEGMRMGSRTRRRVGPGMARTRRSGGWKEEKRVVRMMKRSKMWREIGLGFLRFQVSLSRRLRMPSVIWRGPFLWLRLLRHRTSCPRVV